MKTLKYILIILLIAIVGIVVTAMVTQETNYDLSQSKVINVSPEVASEYISDLKTWDAWGPWKEEHPGMTTEYGEITKGLDASMTWKDAGGEGTLKITEFTPSKSINTALSFDGNPSNGYWSFEPDGEGTKVTWGMKGEKGFVFKIFAMLMGFDETMATMQNRGLDNIANTISSYESEAAKAPSFKISEIETMDIEEKYLIGYSHSGGMEEIKSNFDSDMPKAGIFAGQEGIENYIPGAVWNKWDVENNLAEYSIGLVVGNADKMAEGMEKSIIPAGKVLKVSKWGPYGTGDMEAHNAIEKYMQENDLEHVITWEEYANDPTSVKPEEIQTDIYYGVK